MENNDICYRKQFEEESLKPEWFSTRVWDGIKRLNLVWVNDLIRIIETEDDLKKTFGQKSIDEIFEFFKKYSIENNDGTKEKKYLNHCEIARFSRVIMLN